MEGRFLTHLETLPTYKTKGNVHHLTSDVAKGGAESLHRARGSEAARPPLRKGRSLITTLIFSVMYNLLPGVVKGQCKGGGGGFKSVYASVRKR